MARKHSQIDTAANFAFALAVLFAGVAFLAPVDVHACECGRFQPFLPVARTVDLVVRGRILHFGKRRGRAAFMKVKIRRVWRGREKHEIITIVGDNGKSCRPRVLEFKAGAEYVFALYKISPPVPAPKAKAKVKAPLRYQLSVCGAYWLKIYDRKVKGRILTHPTRAGRYITAMRVTVLRRKVRDLKYNRPGD